MALPTLEKTWQFSVNNVYLGTTSFAPNASTEALRDSLFGLKNILKAFASNPWTVVSSGNSVTTGASDLWTTSANLVWSSGGAHSWIVLQQAGLLANFQICIDLKDAAKYKCDVWVSPNAGFTGGSTTARPTAADEVECTLNTFWTGAWGATDSFVLHVLMSTDGQCTRIFHTCDGLITGFWLFDKIKNPPAAITYPFIATVIGSADVATHAPSYGKLYDVYAFATAANGFSVNNDSILTCEGTLSNALGQLLVEADDLNGEWLFMPVGIFCRTSGARGRYGELYDFWFGSNWSHIGTHFDATNNVAFCQLRDVIVPANGTTLKA